MVTRVVPGRMKEPGEPGVRWGRGEGQGWAGCGGRVGNQNADGKERKAGRKKETGERGIWQEGGLGAFAHNMRCKSLWIAAEPPTLLLCCKICATPLILGKGP